MREVLEEIFPSSHRWPGGVSWWKLVLAGLLAFVFGLAAILIPVRVMSARFLDAVFGRAKPLSAGMTAVAAMLAFAALVAIDALLNLFGAGVMEGRRGTRIRIVVGIAAAVAVILRPGMTAYVAVELIGACAVLVGILELAFLTAHWKQAKYGVAALVCSLACIALGVFLMMWVFAGAVLVGAVVGIFVATKGIMLIMTGVRERMNHEKANETRQDDKMAA